MAYLFVKSEFRKTITNSHPDRFLSVFFKIVKEYFFMKMSDWSYENEYRIVYQKSDSKIININDDLDVVDVNDDDIECIIIGSSVSPLRRKRLKFLIQGRFPKVAVKQCQIVGYQLKISVA